jgi:outer membrane immunogenic protein
MVYGTGGAAWGGVDTTINQDCRIGCGSSPTALNVTSATNTTKSGWVAGLSVEAFVVGNWTARAEWLHIDLGTISASLATPVGVGTQTTTWSRTERFGEFRVGIKYVFR